MYRITSPTYVHAQYIPLSKLLELGSKIQVFLAKINNATGDFITEPPKSSQHSHKFISKTQK